MYNIYEEREYCYLCGNMNGDGSTPYPYDFEEAEDYKYERLGEPPCPECGRKPSLHEH